MRRRRPEKGFASVPYEAVSLAILSDFRPLFTPRREGRDYPP
jgi:hypothetical protein